MGGRTVPKPWGKEEILWEEELVRVKRLYINPNQRLSKQYHPSKVESVIRIKGEVAYIEIESSTRAISDGTFISIPAGAHHRMYAGSTGCVLLELSIGPEETVRLEDDYGR